MVICLGRRAKLHTAQLMPLPPTCHLSLASLKCRLALPPVLPFWYWLTEVVPDKRPLQRCSSVPAVISPISLHAHKAAYSLSANLV